MPKIIQLSPHIANLIAAGEVVERPASVVKELLENAVDAGASKVTIEIRDGGMTFLRVTDNGCGMAAEDARTAFKRHATSKLRTEEDLAAIGSAEAGELYGLVKLEGHIEQSSGNTTRFAVFARSAKAPTAKDNRFVMTFTVGNQAGALGKAVSVIGAHGFNLAALKSRPTKNQNWDYYFFVEGEGNIYSPEGKAMVKELADCCTFLGRVS